MRATPRSRIEAARRGHSGVPARAEAHGSKGLCLLCLWLGLTLPAAAGLAGQAPPSGQTTTRLTELSLDELMEIEVPTVYGASKRLQKVTEAPSSVSIVTAEEIKKFGHRTLADVLQSVRGLQMSYDRNYTYLGMRGFSRPGDYNSRVLVLVDGHRLNDNVYGGVLVGTEFILDVDLISHVEVIRGPGSSLYGNNAFFGVINVVTKNGRDFGGPELSGSAASFDSYQGRWTYGAEFRNGVDLLLSGTLYDSAGRHRLYYPEYDAPETNYGVTEGADDDHFHSAFANVSYRDFRFQGALVSREKGIPTGAYETVFGSSRNRTVDASGYLDLRYEHTFAESLDVLVRAYYDHYHYHGDYLTDYEGVGDPIQFVLNKDNTAGDWVGGEIQLRYHLFDRHTFTAGAELRDDLRQDQSNYDHAPYALRFRHKGDTDNWGAYAQAEVGILTNLILNAGVRFDEYDSFGQTLNPRAGLIYHPWPRTGVKLLYGSAFRAPNAYELAYQDGSTAKANPALDPEMIQTYEVVFEQYLGAHVRASVSGFYYEIDDLIDQTTDPADDLNVFRNLAKVDAKGAEFELEAQWASGFRGRVSYTLQEARDRKHDHLLSNSPRHLFKANLLAPLYRDKLFAGLEVQNTSRRATVGGGHAPDHWLANATLFSQNLLKGLELSGSVYNLFDRRYGHPGGVEHRQDVLWMDGRTFRLKLTYRF
jgi:iron complex outermembrane receptor protein